MTQNEDARQAIEQHNANLARWYATGEIDLVASVFAEDAWQMPPHNPALTSRAAIRSYWRSAAARGEWEFNFLTQAVEASGALAVERGKYTLKFKAGASAPSGTVTFEDKGAYLVHWRYEADEQWRIVSGAWVSELPLQSAEKKSG